MHQVSIMARKERGVFRMIFNDFIKSLTQKPGEPILMGEDYYGTKYFESAPRSGSSKRPARHFEPINKDDHTQELPAEWEAWLRYRRRDAPTKEEIDESYRIILMKRDNAAKLTEAYAVEKVEKLSSPASAENPGSFPVYEEYQEFGMHYKDKMKK